MALTWSDVYSCHSRGLPREQAAFPGSLSAGVQAPASCCIRWELRFSRSKEKAIHGGLGLPGLPEGSSSQCFSSLVPAGLSEE